jgi:putative ABC transport system permease protein
MNGSHFSSRTLGAVVFRWLSRLLPSDFRGDFGHAMSADLDRDDVRWWTREIPGLLTAIVREHLDVLRQDVAYALRLMRRTPGFTAIAILMLALGTGVNVAMFSVIDAVMLRSPFVDPQRLAYVRSVDQQDETPLVTADQLPRLESLPMVERVGWLGGGTHVLTGVGDAVDLKIECVSASMFDVLGRTPTLGRTMLPDEDRPGAPPAIVLSHVLWQRLGGSPSILGRRLTINHTPVTIVGVMPRGYYGAQARPDTDGWMPYARPVQDDANSGCRARSEMTVVARLALGITRDAANRAGSPFRFEVLESVWMDTVRRPLEVLAAAVGCVLLVACLNVGGLQIERTLMRQRELAVRLALGAGRGRIARQLLTESVLFAAIGATAGVTAATLSLRALVAIMPPTLPYLDEISVNGRALGMAVAIGGVAGLLCGLFPVFTTRTITARHGLGSARTTHARSGRARATLVVSQVALSLVVLVAAGLMIRTFVTLRPTSPGFDPDHKLWQPARLRGATPERNARFFEHLFERLGAVSAIRAVAGTTYVPMIGVSLSAHLPLDGARRRVLSNSVTPNYFEVLRIPFRAGRPFLPADTLGAEPVVIVNETLARRIDPSGQIIGRRVQMDLAEMGVPGPAVARTVVGIVADARSNGHDLRSASVAFLPFAQTPGARMTLLIDYQPGRSAEAAAAVRDAIRAFEPGFVFAPASELRQMIDDQVATPRLGAALLALFAGLAVLLAAVGLATTLGAWVTQRSREIGVRVALGASTADVARVVGGQGLAMTVAGIAAGLAGAALVTRTMQSWIYGVTPVDPATFALAAALMTLVAVAAIAPPLRRAVRIDPAVTLRDA